MNWEREDWDLGSQGYITKRWGKLNYNDKPEKYCHGFNIFTEIYTQLQIMLAVLFFKKSKNYAYLKLCQKLC